jgi:hypothetical protein
VPRTSIAPKNLLREKTRLAISVGGVAIGRREHDGATYFLYSEVCLARFDADPDRYVTQEAPA